MSTAELRRLLNECAAKHRGDAVCDSTTGSENDGDIRSTIHSAVRLAAADYASSCVSQSLSDQPPQAQGAVVVCGTAFIMSEARAALGVAEDRDSDDLYFSPALLMPTADPTKSSGVQQQFRDAQVQTLLHIMLVPDW